MLELGEDLLDRVEIGAVGRQEDHMSANGADCCSGGLALVRAKVVQDHDISLCECGDEHRLDIGCEEIAVDRPVDDPWCIDTIMAKRGDEGEGFPVPVRGACIEPLPTQPPAAQGCHVGLDPRLIDEHEPFEVNLMLMCLPADAFASNIPTGLFRRKHGFF